MPRAAAVGLVSTVQRATPPAASLSLAERRAGAALVRSHVERYQPPLVALLGLTWYPIFFPSGVSPGPGLKPERLHVSAIDRPDACFDVVASRMGLMSTPDRAVAFAEIHRVLVPSGRIGALTWAGIEHNPWMTCVGMAAMINGLVTGPLAGVLQSATPDQRAAVRRTATELAAPYLTDTGLEIPGRALLVTARS